MISTFLPFILLLTVYPPPVNPLRCYHCSNPSRKIAHNLWIHKTQTCTRRKPMLCPPESVACVIVRVSHPLLSFTASGCSEDKFVGCDLHNLKHINTTMKRCQCSTSYCNKDLHMKGFHNFVPATNSSSHIDLTHLTGDLINPKPITQSTQSNGTQYRIQLLDQLTGASSTSSSSGEEEKIEDSSQKQKHRLKMLKKQKEMQAKQEKLMGNAGNSFNFISFFVPFVSFLNLYFLLYC